MVFLKQNWKIILLIFVLMAVGFYWFQYRPYKARKDCAWKRMHTDAIPYKPAVERTRVEIDTCKQKCNTDNNSNQFIGLFCEDDCNSIPEQKFEPEKNWWGQTTETEYKTCLRGKGF